MKLVREIKKFGYQPLIKVMRYLGWHWSGNRPPTNVEQLTCGVPRVELERILGILERDYQQYWAGTKTKMREV